MSRKPALHKITMFLLKEGLTRADVLQDAGEVSGLRVPRISGEHDSLFVAASSPHMPSWVSFLAAYADGDLRDLQTASASALLLLEANERLFAVTFGQGRHLLAPEAYEQDFGLKVVLNTVAPEQLKSVDAKTIEETTLHTRRDVSRDSSFSAFGLDISRDLLRAVTGTPRDKTLAHRLAGSDALGLWTRGQLPELPALAGRLLEAYHSDEYKQNFEFIDYLRPEKRAGRLRELEQTLLEVLNTREIDDAHMAAPEVLDPIDVGGFRFSTQSQHAEPAPDPRISVYLKTRAGGNIDIPLLKADHLNALGSADEQLLRRWSVYRSIVFEVTLHGDLYVLTGGAWFRVNLDFKQGVYADVDALPRLKGLPPADRGTDEDAYNRKAAAALDAVCLDRKLVLDGGPDRMEVCDILTRDKGLIHVKQRGASSTLSHLFMQGLNSATRLLQDDEFRRQARELAAREDPSFAEIIPSGRPADPAAFEITFAVITRSKRQTPLTLPFFSVVSLRAAAERLRASGFRVSIAEVHEED